MRVGQAGFISKKGGGLIEKQVMKGLVRVQIASGGGEHPKPETGSHDGKRQGIEVMEKPAFEEAGAGHRITIQNFGRPVLACVFLRLDHGAGVHLFTCTLPGINSSWKFRDLSKMQGAVAAANGLARAISVRRGNDRLD